MMDKLTEEFLVGIKGIEGDLLALGLHLSSTEEVGVGHFSEFVNSRVKVQFLFGPSDWDVEMIIYTSKGKFAFKDLLLIPAISEWVNENKYGEESGRNVRGEICWYVDLLKFALRFIE